MTKAVELIVHGAAQLLTLAGRGPRCGEGMSQLGIVTDGAVAIGDGRVVAVGSTPEVLGCYRASRQIDAGGRVVLPGLIDPHTHVVFAGSREGEFEQRIAGASYLEIMAAGGGIMNTVRATRAAPLSELIEEAKPRLARMLAHGTTTAEAKTGYGLTTAAEIKCLDAAHHLNGLQPLELIPTFLGAHAVPAEYKGQAGVYVELVINEMLPAVCEWARSAQEACSDSGLPFCDVFCDEGAFDLGQTHHVLEAAKAAGMPLKVHADEFVHLGAAKLSAELGAVSADHLLRTPVAELQAMAQAGVVAVLLPGTPFGLGQDHYADARAMIDAQVPVALGTDLNPGTCYCESMLFIMGLACRYMRMTPAEAVVASTVNAAHAIGRGHDLGCLQPGFVADLILLDAADYRHMAYRFGANLVQMVIKRGKVVAVAQDE